MATQKKRKSPRASFVVTIAAVSAMTAAVLPGCGTTVSAGCPEAAPSYGSSCAEEGQSCSYGDDGCGNPLEYACEDGAWGYGGSVGTCNPPPPQVCPDTTPAQGSGCYEVGATCDYTDECGSPVTATCTDGGTWTVDIGTCNPPPPECPADLPAQGDPCDPAWDSFCYYTVDTGCGPMDAIAECAGDVWQVSTPICNPPPPEYCYTLAGEADCAANGPLCRWLVPGCADPGGPTPPLSQAGCFPSFDCVSSDECAAGTTCAEVVIDPCYNAGCDACAAPAMLCVAP